MVFMTNNLKVLAFTVFASLASGDILRSSKFITNEDKQIRDAYRLLQTSCECGGGLDYGCDQRACGPGASCQAGHCIQDGLDSPSCDGGDCSQENTTNASCKPGNCCPPLKNCDTVDVTGSDCIGGKTRLFSCTHNKFLPAWDLSVGDSVRSMTDYGPTCSEIYYHFRHESISTAYVIKTESPNEDFDEIIVSPNHLIYTGSFEKRRAISSKNLRIGDILTSSDGKLTRRVVSIELTQTNLVNVLTLEPAIELESGVIISTNSFHDVVYSYIFWPFALAYKYLGLGVTRRAEPILERMQMSAIANIAISILSTFNK